MSIVKLEGVEEIDRAFRIAETKIREVIANTVTEICKTGEEEAKRIITEMGAVDTGALRQSIEGNLVKLDVSSCEGQIGAGKPEVSRGAGDFEFSQKTGHKRDMQATSEYAEKVEFGGGYGNKVRPFMGSTLNWLKSEFPKKMVKALQSTIKRIGK